MPSNTLAVAVVKITADMKKFRADLATVKKDLILTAQIGQKHMKKMSQSVTASSGKMKRSLVKDSLVIQKSFSTSFAQSAKSAQKSAKKTVTASKLMRQNVVKNVGKMSRASAKEMLRLTDASKVLGLAFTALFAATFAARIIKNIVNVAATFEQSMADVKAITNTTGQTFKKLTDIALEMGRTTVFTASEAAEGLKFLGMAGFNASRAMKALPGTLQLASAAGIELGRAADIVTNVLGAMRLEVSDLGHVNDVLAATITRSNTNMEELAAGLTIAAPVAAAFGDSLEDVTSILGGMADSGKKSAAAGQALKQIYSRLSRTMQDTGDAVDETGQKLSAAKETMKALGVNAIDPTTGKMRGLIDILIDLKKAGLDATQSQKIFGRFTFSSALLAINAADTIKELRDGMNDVNGVAAKMANIKLDTFSGQFKLVTSAFTGLGIALGNVVVRNSTVTEALKNLAGFFSQLSQIIDDNKESIMAFIGAYVNGLTVIGSFTKQIFTSLQTKQEKLNKRVLGLFEKQIKLREKLQKAKDTLAQRKGGFGERSAQNAVKLLNLRLVSVQKELDQEVEAKVKANQQILNSDKSTSNRELLIHAKLIEAKIQDELRLLDSKLKTNKITIDDVLKKDKSLLNLAEESAKARIKILDNETAELLKGVEKESEEEKLILLNASREKLKIRNKAKVAVLSGMDKILKAKEQTEKKKFEIERKTKNRSRKLAEKFNKQLKRLLKQETEDEIKELKKRLKARIKIGDITKKEVEKSLAEITDKIKKAGEEEKKAAHDNIKEQTKGFKDGSEAKIRAKKLETKQITKIDRDTANKILDITKIVNDQLKDNNNQVTDSWIKNLNEFSDVYASVFEGLTGKSASTFKSLITSGTLAFKGLGDALAKTDLGKGFAKLFDGVDLFKGIDTAGLGKQFGGTLGPAFAGASFGKQVGQAVQGNRELQNALSIGGGALGGALAGAQLGTIGGLPGIAAGAVIGGIAGLAGSNFGPGPESTAFGANGIGKRKDLQENPAQAAQQFAPLFSDAFNQNNADVISNITGQIVELTQPLLDMTNVTGDLAQQWIDLTAGSADLSFAIEATGLKSDLTTSLMKGLSDSAVSTALNFAFAGEAGSQLTQTAGDMALAFNQNAVELMQNITGFDALIDKLSLASDKTRGLTEASQAQGLAQKILGNAQLFSVDQLRQASDANQQLGDIQREQTQIQQQLNDAIQHGASDEVIGAFQDRLSALSGEAINIENGLVGITDRANNMSPALAQATLAVDKLTAQLEALKKKRAELAASGQSTIEIDKQIIAKENELSAAVAKQKGLTDQEAGASQNSADKKKIRKKGVEGLTDAIYSLVGLLGGEVPLTAEEARAQDDAAGKTDKHKDSTDRLTTSIGELGKAQGEGIKKTGTLSEKFKGQGTIVDALLTKVQGLSGGIRNIPDKDVHINVIRSETTVQGNQKNAAGGIIERPTFLGFSNGRGQIGGEAGPEAVLPLQRDAQGRLGVIGGNGGNGVTVNINVDGNIVGNESAFRDFTEQIGIEISNLVGQGIVPALG